MQGLALGLTDRQIDDLRRRAMKEQGAGAGGGRGGSRQAGRTVVCGRHEDAAAKPAHLDLMHGDTRREVPSLSHARHRVCALPVQLHGHSPWRRHVALEQPAVRLDRDHR